MVLNTIIKQDSSGNVYIMSQHYLQENFSSLLDKLSNQSFLKS
jgi:hypothetical protein